MDDGGITKGSYKQILPSEGSAVKRSHGRGEPIVFRHQNASSAGKDEIIGQDAVASGAVALDPRSHPSALKDLNFLICGFGHGRCEV